ncbi:hypothetical protein C1H46_034733 [Malus baccata]|uniref:Uncharacterized protein n=1 Tax=Malus baccata TaxID=106549 RepID=A0A540KZQ9_MALBA|nr:hypothetical protein C1H46_034733 [Malus baccata]
MTVNQGLKHSTSMETESSEQCDKSELTRATRPKTGANTAEFIPSFTSTSCSNPTATVADRVEAEPLEEGVLSLFFISLLHMYTCTDMITRYLPHQPKWLEC